MTDEVNATFLGGYSTKSGVPNDSIDRAKIDEIIKEASKGSKFYQFQQRREQRITERVANMRIKMKEISKNEALLLKTETELEKWVVEAENSRDISHTFIHVDMDAFYAAVETLKRPEYATIPMAVGGESMLCTANYEARKYGVVSAMPGYIARKLCPRLTILPMDFPAYRQASDQVHEILRNYDPSFSSFSLDEASLDITEYLRVTGRSAVDVAHELRRRVQEKTKLTCSAGIGPNRQMAKMCSNINKPNGQFHLESDRDVILAFISEQPVKRISGVGKVSAKILEDLLSVKTCGEIVKQIKWIKLLFSEIQFEFLVRSALGMGVAFGGEGGGEWNRKSISCERTFRTITDPGQMIEMLKKICEHLAEDVEENEVVGRTVGIKLKSSNFDVQTRAVTLERTVHTAEELFKYSLPLLRKNTPKDLRLLGVRLSGLVTPDEGEHHYRSLDEFIAEGSIAYPECPLCGKQIRAHPDDTLRINEHIDKCLDPIKTPPPKKRRNLGDFFKIENK